MNSTKISYKKPLLETPFHERTSDHCYSNDWYRWAGYKVAKEYSSTELEYTSMRNTAGVIDITPMHKYEIKGEDAKRFINKFFSILTFYFIFMHGSYINYSCSIPH